MSPASHPESARRLAARGESSGISGKHCAISKDFWMLLSSDEEDVRAERMEFDPHSLLMLLGVPCACVAFRLGKLQLPTVEVEWSACFGCKAESAGVPRATLP